MSEFHFLRPFWLGALVPLAVLLFQLHRRQRAGGAWLELVDAALRPAMLIGRPAPASRWPVWLTGMGGILTIVALAGPTWQRLPAPVFRDLAALVVVLDLSPAMDATDLKPSRLERARYKIEDILRARKGGQTALVVYSGDAFTVTPLTDDVATITAQLGALAPRLMPVAGARIDLALARAESLLQQAGVRGGEVLLVTAGEGATQARAAAEHLLARGHRLAVLGVGTADGAPIPLPSGGFLKDERGAIVIPRLDAAALQRLALAGGGLYRGLDSGSADLEALLAFLDRRGDGAGDTGIQIAHWQEAGIYLLPMLLPLAALGFRRGWLGAGLLLILLPAARPAQAFDWLDLWLTPDQRAQRELRAGQAEAAAQHFRDPNWKAAAEYRAGQYEAAAATLGAQDSAPAHYNRGNALAKAGKLEEALQAYDRALRLNPQDEDAAFNRKLVEEALRKRQKEQPSPQQQGQEQGQRPEPSSGDDGQPSQQSRQPQSDPQHSPAAGVEGSQRQPENRAESPGEQRQSPAAPASGQGSPETPAQPSGDEREPTPEPDAGDTKTPQPEGAEAGDAQPGSVPEAEAGQQRADESTPPASGGKHPEESRQAQEQWLRRIPDDPGGLLKRKFYYQYQRRQQAQESPRNPW